MMIAAIGMMAGPARAGEGSLARDEIRKVVRGQISEIRHCYNEGLSRKPELAGKLTVDFEITASGAVSSSVIQASTLGDTTMETCVAATVKTWTFPQPSGGSVKVSYPFEFAPG